MRQGAGRNGSGQSSPQLGFGGISLELALTRTPGRSNAPLKLAPGTSADGRDEGPDMRGHRLVPFPACRGDDANWGAV